MPHRSRNPGRTIPGGTNSFAGQFLHQTPVQSSKSIQCMQTVQGFQNPISSLKHFDVGPVFPSQIKKLRKSFTWWNQLLCRSVLTPNSCTEFKIHSAHADNPRVPNPISSLKILMYDQSLSHRSRNSGRALLGGTNSFTGQFQHQTPVQSSRSIQHMLTVPIPNQISSLNNLI